MPYPLDHRAKSGDPGATRTPSISVRSAAFFPLNYGAEEVVGALGLEPSSRANLAKRV